MPNKKIKRIGIINVNLQYEIPNGVNAKDYLCNVELPPEYVEDSFDIVKIIGGRDAKRTK